MCKVFHLLVRYTIRILSNQRLLFWSKLTVLHKMTIPADEIVLSVSPQNAFNLLLLLLTELAVIYKRATPSQPLPAIKTFFSTMSHTCPQVITTWSFIVLACMLTSSTGCFAMPKISNLHLANQMDWGTPTPSLSIKRRKRKRPHLDSRSSWYNLHPWVHLRSCRSSLFC